MADQEREKNKFNRDVTTGTVSLIGFILKHPLIFIGVLAALLIVVLVLFVIFAVAGAPASFAESIEEAFQGHVTAEGVSVDAMTDEEKALFYNDAENIYQAIEDGKFQLTSNDLVNLDEKSVKAIFKRIHDYEERRKEEKEVTYTYRVENEAETEYETKEDEEGNQYQEVVDEGYHIAEHPMNDIGEIDTDEVGNKHVTYSDQKKITIERKQLETVYDGEKDLMKIDWQPVFALLSCVAVDNYANWNEEKLIKNKDSDDTFTLDGYFLKDSQIDAVIDIFYYDDKSDGAYYYDLLDSGQKDFSFLNMVKKSCAFKLQVEENDKCRITERIPCSAPYLIQNKYRHFLYKYERMNVNTGNSEAESEDKTQEETASNEPGVTIIGDSITEYSLNELKEALPDAFIDGKAGRTVHLRTPEQQGGLETAEILKAEGHLGDIVVFAMGTNNAGPEVNNQPYLTEDMLDQLKSIVGDRRVFLVTNYDMSDAYEHWWEKNNQVIRSYAAKQENWSVIDWASKTGPSYLVDEPDGVHKGVHPNAEGKKLFASMIKEALTPYEGGSGGTKTYIPTGDALKCTERQIITSGKDFEAAVKAIDPDFDWDFFLNNLEPLPNADPYVEEFTLLRLDAESGTDRVVTTTDENECSAIGTILVNGRGVAIDPNGTPYVPTAGKMGEVPYEGPTGAIPYYDVFDESHSLTALNKDYTDDSGTVYPGVGTYNVDQDAYRGLDRSDNLTVPEIETLLATKTDRFNPGCALFSSTSAIQATAQTLYDCQEQFGVSLCGVLAVACHECGNFKPTKNVTEHWNYFSITGSGAANYTGGYHFVNYPVERGAKTPQDALAMQIEWFVEKMVKKNQRNYVSLCWTGNNPAVGRSSIVSSYCPYWEDYAMPASGSIYGTSLTPSGRGWSGNSARNRRELEAAAGIVGVNTGVD